MYIVLFIHLLLAQFLPAQAALQPLNPVRVYTLSVGSSSHDGDVCGSFSDIFADSNDERELDDNNNKVSNPIDHIYYSANLTNFTHSFSKTKTISVFLYTRLFPNKKLFLLYNQLKLDC